MGRGALALALPEVTEAHCCPQLERSCLLATGNLERLLETRLCLSLIVRREGEQQLPFEPIELRLAVTPSFVDFGQRLGQHKQPFPRLSHFRIRFGQQRKQVRSFALCASGPVRSQALAHLCNSLRRLSLFNQRPAQEDGPMRQEERVFCGEHDVCLRLLSRLLYLSAVEIKPSGKVQGVHQHKRMSKLSGQGDRVLDAHEGSVRIAQIPEVMGSETVANHRGVFPVRKGQGGMLSRVIENNALGLMLLSTDELSVEVKRRRHRAVRYQEHCRILG